MMDLRLFSETKLRTKFDTIEYYFYLHRLLMFLVMKKVITTHIILLIRQKKIQNGMLLMELITLAGK